MQSITIKVSLDEFFEEDIVEYAKDHLDMVKIDDLSNENFYYHRNSITTKAAYDRLLNNVGRIPIQEIENLLDKYNCI